MPPTEDLLDQWMSTYSHDEKFIKDGIINIEYWGKTQENILFLLKEINLAPGSWSATRPLDVQRDFRKTANEAPWKEIGQWAYGILNRKNQPPFDEANNKNNRNKACRSVAIVNLKKIGCGNNSNSSIIKRYAIRDAEFLRKQIDLINPKIIICCGKNLNFNIAKQVFSDAYAAKELINKSDFIPGRLLKGKRYYWVDYVHPRMRKGKEAEKYGSLLNLVESIPSVSL